MNDLRTLPAFTVTETPEGVLIAKSRAATKLALCAYPGMDGALCEALWHWAQLYANGLAVTHEGAVVALPPAAAQALIRRVKAYAAWAAAREALIREGWAPPAEREGTRPMGLPEKAALAILGLMAVSNLIALAALLFEALR